jgi:transcription termination factor Rho
MEHNLNKIQNDLFHIHSLANLLIGKYQEMIDAKQIIEPLDEPSSPLFSVAEMIMEKSKNCIDKADIMDAIIQQHGIGTLKLKKNTV